MSYKALVIDAATPSDYLRRVRLWNQEFGDNIRVEGITKSGSLVISQTAITGRKSTREEIESTFASLGWEKVPEDKELMTPLLSGTSYYHPDKRLIVVDARPANVLVDDNGELAPIDLMVDEIGDSLAKHLDIKEQRQKSWTF